MEINGYIEYGVEIYIYYVDMPCSIESNVVENPDGSYTLYLNSRFTHEKNIEGYLHELDHIENEDFKAINDIHDVEVRARKD